MASIEYARSLYQQKKYANLSTECLQLVESNEHVKEASVLSTKGLIQTLNPEDESRIKTYHQRVCLLAQMAETRSELNWLKYDLHEALEQRRVSYAKEYIKAIPSSSIQNYFNNWSNYVQRDVDLLKQKMYTTMMIAQNAPQNLPDGKTSDAEGEQQPAPYDGTDDRMAVIFAGAEKLFKRAMDLYNKADDCNNNAALDLCDMLVHMTLLSEMMLDYTAPEKETEQSEKRLASLKKKAEVMDWRLKTVIHLAGGEAISVYNGNRVEAVQNLKSLYNEIAELDEDFVPAELPSTKATRPSANTQPAQSAQYSGGGGGCYVATAVYGSYDCPQVWTLRRFRDNTLAATWYGRLFVHMYYAISPTLVKMFGRTTWFKNLWKPQLDKLVVKLNARGVCSKPYEDIKW